MQLEADGRPRDLYLLLNYSGNPLKPFGIEPIYDVHQVADVDNIFWPPKRQSWRQA
jgi:hypothetical protein